MPPFAKLAVVVCFQLTIPCAGLLAEEDDYYYDTMLGFGLPDFGASKLAAITALPSIGLDKLPDISCMPDLPDIPGLPDVMSCLPPVPIPGLPDFGKTLNEAMSYAVDSAERRALLVTTMLKILPSIVAASTVGTGAVLDVICDAAIQIAIGDTLKELKEEVPTDAAGICKPLAPQMAQTVSDLMEGPTGEPASQTGLIIAARMVKPAVKKTFEGICTTALQKAFDELDDKLDAQAGLEKVIQFMETGMCKMFSKSIGF